MISDKERIKILNLEVGFEHEFLCDSSMPYFCKLIMVDGEFSFEYKVKGSRFATWNYPIKSVYSIKTWKTLDGARKNLIKFLEEMSDD